MLYRRFIVGEWYDGVGFSGVGNDRGDAVFPSSYNIGGFANCPCCTIRCDISGVHRQRHIDEQHQSIRIADHRNRFALPTGARYGDNGDG